MFSTQTYIERRNTLKRSVGSGLILIMGNEEAPMNYHDNTYRYRQDSNFLYYFGISLPNLAAIIDVDSGEEIIYGDEFSMDDIIWVGPQPTLADQARRVGVYRTDAYAKLAEKLSKAGKVHFTPPYRYENKFKLNSWLNIPVAQLKERASTDLIKAIVGQRSYKSAEEIVQMEEAVNITREMHLTAMRETRAGRKEFEIAALLHQKALEGGGDLAYPIIFSINGQTLHNHYHGNTMTEGKLALNDSGAENSMFYAGDITRTIPVSKTFTEQQKEIYNVVLQMQLKAIEALKPGVLFRDVHLLANQVLLEGLDALGIVKGDINEMLALGVQGLFMPHGLGHAIGLDVHDMEDLGENFVGYREGLERSTQLGLKSLRLAKELEAGFVVTVEPGLYFIPELIEKWKAENQFTGFVNYDRLEAYKDFGGVRIEDNCLITDTGYKVLGKPIPKTVEEVENLKN
ncbi:aminopeptidase P family protein [Emticicia sp. 21SJ11W-3]|uniref:aminopeptidase P family protein n=1 Tax=Emticicia sp. 21SJ11W-3 TaxID=2916755 RepID=UPI0020A1E467|nr:aminopeptidase P family protein [Emticicia sp. 21SJ11W-3]UTA69668.1 aminopeptidase P family protein [Emticicia sp. 21SJ11W-3]